MADPSKRILVATDFSRGSEEAFAAAVELARQTSATLEILHVLELLTEARARGASALISSHQLHDIERACDRICLIDRGRVQEVVTLAEIHRRSRSTISVRLAHPLPQGLERLPDTTVVSIGHRSTLAAFHARSIRLAPTSSGSVLRL